MAEQASNRRIYPRYELEVEVNLASEHNFYTGFTENISEGGMFIATYQLCEIGTRFSFQFTLPDSPTPIEVLGEVCWLREGGRKSDDDFHPGMGVRFLELTPKVAARIVSFLQNREAIFYED